MRPQPMQTPPSNVGAGSGGLQGAAAAEVATTVVTADAAAAAPEVLAALKPSTPAQPLGCASASATVASTAARTPQQLPNKTLHGPPRPALLPRLRCCCLGSYFQPLHPAAAAGAVGALTASTPCWDSSCSCSSLPTWHSGASEGNPCHPSSYQRRHPPRRAPAAAAARLFSAARPTPTRRPSPTCLTGARAAW